MSRTRITTLALLVIGALCLAYAFIDRSAESSATHASASATRLPAALPTPPVKPTAESREADEPSATDKAVADAAIATVPPSPADPAPTAAPAYLSAETALLADLDGHQGLNVRAITDLVKGDRFRDFMDQLANEAATSSLALDIAELYSQSAAEANAAGGDQLAIRIACGMTVCGLSATAPSKDVFDAWFAQFIGNPSALPYGVGRYDQITDAGVVEHRLVFSTDQARQHVIMPGQ